MSKTPLYTFAISVSVCDKAGKTLLKQQLLAIHTCSYYFMSK